MLSFVLAFTDDLPSRGRREPETAQRQPSIDQWNLFLSAFSSFSKKISILPVILGPMSLHHRHASILMPPKDKDARAVVLDKNESEMVVDRKDMQWVRVCEAAP